MSKKSQNFFYVEYESPLALKRVGTQPNNLQLPPMSSSRELHAHFFCSKALEKHKKTNQTISHQKLSEGKGEESEKNLLSFPPLLR